MKWYKRDPDAALVGMRGLTDEQFRAYSVFQELFYSRNGDVDDAAMLIHLPWNIQRWVRVRDELITLGKLWYAPGTLKLVGKRVESCIKEAQHFGLNLGENLGENFVKTEEVRRQKCWKNNGKKYTTTTTSIPPISPNMNFKDKGPDYRSPPHTKSDNILKPFPDRPPR